MAEKRFTKTNWVFIILLFIILVYSILNFLTNRIGDRTIDMWVGLTIVVSAFVLMGQGTFLVKKGHSTIFYISSLVTAFSFFFPIVRIGNMNFLLFAGLLAILINYLIHFVSKKEKRLSDFFKFFTPLLLLISIVIEHFSPFVAWIIRLLFITFLIASYLSYQLQNEGSVSNGNQDILDDVEF